LLHCQGRLAVGEELFHGPGGFKFSLVHAETSQVAWGNAPDANADGEPDDAVELPVHRGLYSVMLGDTSLPHMAALPPEVFAGNDLSLRVWFNDGERGFQRLLPDQRLGAVGYAMVAGAVPDGSITVSKLAPGTLDVLASQVAALTSQLNVLSNRHETLVRSLAGRPQGVPQVSPLPEDPELTDLGMVRFLTVPGAGWVSGSSQGAPLPRSGHTAVWTGQECLVWGGALVGGALSEVGAGYDPVLDHWRVLSEISAPSARRGHTAVWTGEGMLVWGGFDGEFLGTGGEYDPVAYAWKPMADTGAPAEREGHVAVWTGSRMVVWGGRNGSGLLADGGVYDPATRTWSSLPIEHVPAARVGAAAAWSGTDFIVWGGTGATGDLASGGVLPFADGVTPGVWKAMSAVHAPQARTRHAGVWTGNRFITWGGRSGETPLDTGAAYDVASDQWTPLPSGGAPSARATPVAVWTGIEMLVFGGETVGGMTATGGAFNPATQTWRALSTSGTPLARSEGTGVWTGAELLVFGGRSSGGLLAALQRFDPQSAWYFYRQP
jgi:hypothetical protein